MSYQAPPFTGIIKLIGETETFGSGFNKRTFVVSETDGKYPQDIQFELVKDGVDKIDPYAVGDQITVHFNLRGSEWKDRHFVNLQAWKLEGQGTAARKPPPKQAEKVEEPEDDFDPDEQVPF